MKDLKIKQGIVDRKKYIKAKTAQLKEFGYNSLTEKEVSDQLDKIEKGEKLNVIGMMIQDDL